MASSSSSSVQPRYQVFLSFRGADTRHGFTSHLHKALKERGISAFLDEEKLEKGEQLTPALLNAIEASKISIPILSKNYASSKSCLAELSKIMECKDSPSGQIVLPIFYWVNPSDVRHHGGPFEESFCQHLINKPQEVHRWKADFTRVGDLIGWHIDGVRSESKYIEEIVGVVIEKLKSKSTSVSEDLVGINDHIEELERLIRDQEDTRFIGIWGMGGIGKTTLAQAVYYKVVSGSNKFGAHHFLLNVREEIEKKGMQFVRDDLLHKLLKEDIKIDTPTIGSEVIRDRLRNIRALVVLDDVSEPDQIDGLGVEHLGLGSKIIVTSRDQQVLKNIGANRWHKLEKLNGADSLKLFCNFAFKQYNPIADFRDLSMEFLSYAGGQPLALKVLGRALYGNTRDVWESYLKALEKSPEKSVIELLKISYDELGSLEQKIFLDVACFFTGEQKDDVTRLLDGFYGGGALYAITKLFNKCLLDDRSDYLRMHDLLQEMGRDIVRKESEEPGRRSRLCSAEDIYEVLDSNKGTELIRGMSLDMDKIEAVQIHASILEKMINLVYIKFHSVLGINKLLLGNHDFIYFTHALRYIHWDNYPLKSLPSNFDPHKLIELHVPKSNIEHFCNGDQKFANLRKMNLSRCKNLKKFPTLLGATKLEEIQCYGCIRLVEFPCMRHLISLEDLNLRDCPIKKFPETPTNLKKLNLSNTRIEAVPSFIGSLKKLRVLNMSSTKVKNIPSSISELDALWNLNLSNCPNITELNLNGTPPNQEQPSLVQPLNIPSSIKLFKLAQLTNLKVQECNSLKSLSGLPLSLEQLFATGCPSLQSVSFGGNYQRVFCNLPQQFNFLFDNCFNLNQDARDNSLAAFLMIIKVLAKQSAMQLKLHVIPRWYDEFPRLIYCLPGYEIFDKFENKSKNSSITVKLDSGTSITRFLCFALCVILDYNHFDEFGACSTYVYCEYQLKGIYGFQNFRRAWRSGKWGKRECDFQVHPIRISNDHVFVMFSNDMVHKDMEYEEASFDFKVTCSCYDDDDGDDDDDDYDDDDVADVHEERKVNECGVHVFYVDAYTFNVSDASCNINFSSEEGIMQS